MGKGKGTSRCSGCDGGAIWGSSGFRAGGREGRLVGREEGGGGDGGGGGGGGGVSPDRRGVS